MGFAFLLTLPVAATGAVADEAASHRIGRLNHAGYKQLQHCTATLVAPRVALTAAHCLDRANVAEMHLLLGYDRGAWREHLRPVAALRAAPPSDVAALCLAEPASAVPLPIATRPAQRGEAVVVVGYGKPRVQVANRIACRVTALRGNGAIQLDCPLSPGASGGPVLRETAAGSEVIGVVSATGTARSLAYLAGARETVAACQ